jgi:hypothetical protein
LAILRAIVLETMDYPPVRPHSADSYLPPALFDAAERAVAVATRRRRRFSAFNSFGAGRQ